ncbi:MAG TPA: pitrilysin family protein [Blastocatellia bacterium]
MGVYSRFVQVFFLAIVVTAVIASGFLGPERVSASPEESPIPDNQATLKVPFTQFKLDNGLRVVLSEDHSAPVVAVTVYFDVGSRNETPGHTGFAHLFEHMMFQGSENVPRGAYFKFIESNGGDVNATTHVDFTDYYEFLPSNCLALALWLESDRMRSLKITQESLDNQRKAVEEEKRLSVDNQAYWPELDKMDRNIFHNWAFGHSTFGSMHDLEAASVGDVKHFFDTYYVPNNAVLAICGDIDTSEARALVQRYFASIPARKLPPPVDASESPGARVPKAVAIDSHAEVPEIVVAWKIAQRSSPDKYAIALLKAVLADGDSCRLYQDLVKKKEVAVSVTGGLEEDRGPSDLYFQIVHKPEIPPGRVEAALVAEVNQIKTEGISPEELATVKNQYRLGRFLGTGDDEHRNPQTALGRAMDLAEFTLFDGDPSLINTELDRYMAVKASDIQAVARKYLTPLNRSVFYIQTAHHRSGPASRG